MSELPTSPNEKKGVIAIVKESFKELSETLVAFVNAPKALWGINIPYVIEGLVYFGILTILGKFCAENVHLSDLHAGWVYSLVTGGITFSMLFFGGVSDKLGVRKALILAFIMFLVGRTLIALSGTLSLGTGLGSAQFFMMCVGLLIAVIAYGLYQPAAYAGVKKYTTPQTAAMGYAVIYGLMNLGAFFSGLISPIVRHRFEKVLPPNGLTAVFWVYSILCLSALMITLIVLTKKTDIAAVLAVKKATEELEKEKSEEEKSETEKIEKAPAIEPEKIDNTLFFLYIAGTVFMLILSVFIQLKKLSLAIPFKVGYSFAAISFMLTIYEYLRKRPDHPFRDSRFTFFIFVLIPVQTLFAHNWLTIPFYLDRVFQGSFVSNYFELLSNINPILIFVLAPLVAGLTAKANVYRMMIIGTLVMALPTFLLVITPNVYLFLVYILLMSIGEAMWQPRFLQWIAEVAPEGKTGMYMGIGQFPWFLTKFGTGLFSGYFVAKYMPKPGTGLPQHSETMWLIYACIAMVTPIALILAKKWMVSGMKMESVK